MAWKEVTYKSILECYEREIHSDDENGLLNVCFGNTGNIQMTYREDNKIEILLIVKKEDNYAILKKMTRTYPDSESFVPEISHEMPSTIYRHLDELFEIKSKNINYIKDMVKAIQSTSQ